MKSFRINLTLLCLTLVLLSSSCATIFGGRLTSCQTERPAPGKPARQIRIAALLADLSFGYAAIVPLGIDFLTGAIYKPCEDSNVSNENGEPVIVNADNPIFNIAAVSPSSFFYPEFTELKYERTINSLISVAVNPQYWQRKDVICMEDNMLDIKTIGINFQTRFYLLNAYNAPEGLYIAPMLGTGIVSSKGVKWVDSYSSSKTEIPQIEASYISTGITFGYQWVIKKKILFDIDAGSQRIYSSDKEQTKLFSSDPLFPFINFNIGYAF